MVDSDFGTSSACAPGDVAAGDHRREVAASEHQIADITIGELRQILAVMERAHTILANMALENPQHQTMGYLFKARWPISHEPLRADAKSLLPELVRALEQWDDLRND